MAVCDYCNDSELVDGQPCPSCSAELEIDDIDAELEQLYAAEHANIPYVDDGIRHRIYYLQDLRKELQK